MLSLKEEISMSWNLWFEILIFYEGYLYFISQDLNESIRTIPSVVIQGYAKYFLLTAINGSSNIFIIKT